MLILVSYSSDTLLILIPALFYMQYILEQVVNKERDVHDLSIQSSRRTTEESGLTTGEQFGELRVVDDLSI